MIQDDDAELTMVRKSLARHSDELERLGSRLTVTSAAQRLKLEQEIAEMRAACNDVTERLNALRTSREEQSAEGLRLLVENIGKQLEACARQLGIKK